MTNNTHGPPITRFAGYMKGTRDDPNIGRYKRNRAPSEMLIAYRLTGKILPECDRNVILKLSMEKDE
jgi:hypothetical protein